MSNVLTNRLWTVDSIGILSSSAVVIRRLVYVPASAGQTVTLYSWKGLGSCLAANGKTATTGTITSTTTLTSSGNLPATIALGDIFEIYASSGSANNLNTKNVVTTAGDTNAVVCAAAGWTNESSKVYAWRTYPGVKEAFLPSGASDASPVTLDFVHPLVVNNLSLPVLAGGTLYVYLD